MQDRLVAASVITIQAAPQKVWETLMDPEKIPVFMLGMKPVSTWEKGAELIWIGRHEESPEDHAKGQIMECDPPGMLQYTFYYPGYGYPDKPEYYNRVTWSLEPQGNATLIRVEQGDFSVFKEGTTLVQHTRQFWEEALRKLKDMVE